MQLRCDLDHNTNSARLRLKLTTSAALALSSIRILAYDGQGFWLATKRLSKGRFRWWPTGAEASRSLRAHQAQLLLAGGNPDIDAAPVWRRVSV